MKKQLFSSTLVLTFFIGCVNTMPNGLSNGNSASLEFHTNNSTFLHHLSKETTQEDRNAYMDEFFFNSDMQCQHYLNKPLSTTPQNATDNQLYMNIFDTVSAVFGMKYITDLAKSSFTSNSISDKENQEAYQNALSPEIREGVKIGRQRYAKEIQKKKPLSLKQYSTTILSKDLKKYDKQCNLKYGLIEINRALRASQNNMNQPMAKTVMKINPRLIKAKVEAVTKEVKRKEKIKKEEKKKKEVKEQQTKQPTPSTPPKPSVPVDVQQHHDNAPNLPHSPQISGE